MTLIEILKMKGLDVDSSRIKIVRHQSPPWDLSELVRRGQFEIYQWEQKKDVFKNCDYVITFLGMPGTKAKLIGIYRLTGVQKRKIRSWPENFPFQNMPIESNFQYHAEKLVIFEDIENRLVIDWGKSTRSWHQWLKPRDVVEILPKGYVGEIPDYLEIILSYAKLQEMIKNEDANRIWHQKLSTVKGIYLILDKKSGFQYVGSAYSPEGILGRWKDYAANGHGGNVKLKKLLESNESYVHNFQFTILQTLPKSLTNKEVIEYEVRYKEKLGSRVFGLNNN